MGETGDKRKRVKLRREREVGIDVLKEEVRR